ncbi:MAG TPA: DUF6675 family protein [Rectinemataceae bacterium]|nr:DUF6675 family protein [Rectinemataceae bacterium]
MHIDFRRVAPLFAVYLLAAAVTFSLPLEEAVPGLSKAELAGLQAGEMLLAWPTGVNDMRFPPLGPTGLALRALPEQFKVSVYVESAFLLRGVALDSRRKLEIINNLLKVESLSGVTYYSERKNGIAVLFDNVYRVETPGSTKRLPPLVLSELPPFLETFIHLRDSNFGSSWYALGFERIGEGLLISLQNRRPLSFMLIRAFPINGVRMRVAILPVEEGVYVAAICAADPGKAAASLVDMDSAMEKRLRAVQGWVVAKVRETPR